MSPQDSHWKINTLPDEADNAVRLKRPARSRRWKLLLAAVVVLLTAVSVFSYRAFLTSDGTASWDGSENGGILGRLRSILGGEDRTLKGEKDGQVNILLIGMGGPGHEGAYLADTIMVASWRPSDGQLAMVSIPRDLAVYVPGIGFRKINSVNSTGESRDEGSGGELMRLTVSELLGMEIPYYMRVDFTAFEELVDQIGGLTIPVERSFTDTKYPISETRTTTLSFQKGPQHMDGKRALAYVRSRYGCCGEGNDFARAKRQQIFLSALKAELPRHPELQSAQGLYTLYQNYTRNTTTNLKVWELLRFAELLPQLSSLPVHQLVIDNGHEGILEDYIGADGAYMLQPRGGNYALLKDVPGQMFSAPTLDGASAPAASTEASEEPIHLLILNATGVTGLAQQTADTMRTKGFTEIEIGNAPDTKDKKNYIYDPTAGRFPKTIEKILTGVQATVSTQLPEWLRSQLASPDENVLDAKPTLVIVIGKI